MRLITRRTGTVLLFGVASVLLLGTVKARQIQTMMAQAASFQPPPEAVTTVVAREERWPSRLAAIGTVKAERGVTLSADLPGVVEEIRFESGRAVRAGEVLVELDTRQERAQLAQTEADWNLAKINYGREQQLVSQGVVPRQEFDNAEAQLKSTEAHVGEIKATIERKTIRAPFSGILGIRQINLGQYLAAGQAIVPLQSLNPIYVNFGVPQQDAPRIRIGSTLRVTSGGL